MNTFERLKKVCAEVFEDDVNLDTIAENSNLREDIGINSIGLLYMAMALEEEFSIKFCNEDFYKISTVQDVVKCIEGKI